MSEQASSPATRHVEATNCAAHDPEWVQPVILHGLMR